MRRIVNTKTDDVVLEGINAFSKLDLPMSVIAAAKTCQAKMSTVVASMIVMIEAIVAADDPSLGAVVDQAADASLRDSKGLGSNFAKFEFRKNGRWDTAQGSLDLVGDARS